jgi:hypothetical protein
MVRADHALAMIKGMSTKLYNAPCTTRTFSLRKRSSMTSDIIERGVRGETAVLNRLVQKGFEVLIPWGGRKRYDIAYFVTDEHRNFGFFVHHESYLVRIQVKIGRLALDESGIDFNTTSVHPKGNKHFRRDYVGDAEYFGVYCPELDKVYMVPVSEAPRSGHMILRLTQPKTGQKGGYHFARDYEV